MKKSLLAVMLVAAGITSAQATEVFGGNLGGNLGLTSNYEFRGVSLSNNGPAIQGGIDYQHNSGIYVGNWNSSMRGALNMNNDDIDNNSGVQSNLYAGWRKDVYKGVTVDLGTISYLYPTTTSGGSKINYSTNEVYAGVGYGPVSVKFSQSTSNYFGINNSSGTQYYQADIKQSLGAIAPQLKPLSVVAHYGHTAMAGSKNSNLNYNDMNIGLVYSFPEQWDLGVRYYTNSSMTSTFKQYNSWNGQKFYGDAVVATLVKTF